MYFFSTLPNHGCRLNNTQVDYILKNSNLSHIDDDRWNVLAYILRMNKPYKLNLTSQQWLFLIDNSNLSQNKLFQQNTSFNRSLLGICLENEPQLMPAIFDKIITDKNFDIENYSKDEFYKEIKEHFNIYMTKKSINSNLKIAPKKLAIKI